MWYLDSVTLLQEKISRQDTFLILSSWSSSLRMTGSSFLSKEGREGREGKGPGLVSTSPLSSSRSRMLTHYLSTIYHSSLSVEICRYLSTFVTAWNVIHDDEPFSIEWSYLAADGLNNVGKLNIKSKSKSISLITLLWTDLLFVIIITSTFFSECLKVSKTSTKCPSQQSLSFNVNFTGSRHVLKRHSY